MVRLSWVALAAVLGMASVSVYAKEVNLTDHDRMELRQRADSLQSGNMLGRDRVMSSRTDRHVTKTKHTKKHHTRKHARRGHT